MRNKYRYAGTIFSAAYNPLYIYNNTNAEPLLTEIKADRMPIGVYLRERDFTAKHHQLQKGDKNMKKYKTKQFRQLLSELSSLSAEEQHEALNTKLDNWKGTSQQIDDITVLGITSANELIKNEIKKKNADSIRQDVLKLINNEVVIKNVEENFIFSDFDIDNELLWTLLTHSGYLTIRNKISRKEYELAIPNYELKTIFQDTILKWLHVDVKIKKSLLQNTTKHLINNQITAFEEGFRQIIGDTFSYYDTAKNNEYIYHSYILGLLAIIGDDYIVK